MDSVELYRRLLGLASPRTVERVELDMARQRVEVHVGHAAGQRFACAECGRSLDDRLDDLQAVLRSMCTEDGPHCAGR